MFGCAFKLRMEYLVRFAFCPRFLVSFPRHVSPSLSRKYVYTTFIVTIYSQHCYDWQSFLRIPGLKMFPNSLMGMAESLIVVS